MKFKPLIILSTLSLMLIGCTNGTDKVNYDVFHREAVAAYNAGKPRIKKTKINGWIEVKSYRYEAKNLIITETTDYASLSLSDLVFVANIEKMNGMAPQIADDETQTYYVGNGFRVVSTENDTEIAWDSYLYCTLMKTTSKDASCEIKISYTYIR